MLAKYRFSVFLCIFSVVGTFLVSADKLLLPEQMRETPGLGWLVAGRNANIRFLPSNDSPVDNASLELFAPQGVSGYITTELVDFNNFASSIESNEYSGISFWCKGDGSKSLGVIGFGLGLKHHAMFSLTNTNWHRVEIPFYNFRPKISKIEGPGFLGLAIAPIGIRMVEFAMDDLRLYKEPQGEAEEKLPQKTFINWSGTYDARDYISGPNLADDLKKWKDKLGINILFICDDVVLGKGTDFKMSRGGYLLSCLPRLKYKLGKLFGEKKVSLSLERYDAAVDKWMSVGPGFLRRSGLNIFVKSASGMLMEQMLDFETSFKLCSPDVVIIQKGLDDLMYSDPESYAESLASLITSYQGTARVVVCSPQPSIHNEQPGFAEAAKTVAEAHDVIFVDVNAAFSARGRAALSALYMDSEQLNRYGHEMMAEIMYSIFTDQVNRIWKVKP